MNLKVPRGKYVLAVSGGVDSMVLLDLLAKKPGVEVIVAHFNHGIRSEAGQDEVFVAEKAQNYGLKFVSGWASLGKNASEEAAREARYGFLRETRDKYSTDGIITAHHQDDMIETALLNILRGTSRRGLTSISDNQEIIRPLLKQPKQDLINYAKLHKLEWREDFSNSDNRYLRNYLRNGALKALSQQKRQDLISNIDKVAKNNHELDQIITRLSQQICSKNSINRTKFSNLPVEVGNELIAYWLKDLQIKDFDQTTVNRLNIHIRTSKQGSSQHVKDNIRVEFSQKSAQFVVSVK